MQDLVVVLPHKCELEPVFRGIDRDRTWLGVAVEAVNHLALNPSEVNGLLEGLDDTVIAAVESHAQPDERRRSEGCIYPCGKAYLIWLRVE